MLILNSIKKEYYLVRKKMSPKFRFILSPAHCEKMLIGGTWQILGWCCLGP